MKTRNDAQVAIKFFLCLPLKQTGIQLTYLRERNQTVWRCKCGVVPLWWVAWRRRVR